MALEFKKLSNVEVIAEPSASANVLIEEDGVIKKAPKTAVGGAGNGKYDLDIDMIDDGDRNFTVNINTVNTFENIKNKLLDGIKPNCKVKILATAWTGDPEIKAVEVLDSLLVYYQPQDAQAERSECITFRGIGAHVSPSMYMYPDGEMTAYGNDTQW